MLRVIEVVYVEVYGSQQSQFGRCRVRKIPFKFICNDFLK